MGVASGPAWHSYIAARSLIWTPGTMRRPVPGTGRKRWGWSTDPDVFPVLTLDDLRRLAFGEGDAKHRTCAEILAPWQSLPDVALTEAADKRAGIRGWRLMPTDGVATTGECRRRKRTIRRPVPPSIAVSPSLQCARAESETERGRMALALTAGAVAPAPYRSPLQAPLPAARVLLHPLNGTRADAPPEIPPAGDDRNLPAGRRRVVNVEG